MSSGRKLSIRIELSAIEELVPGIDIPQHVRLHRAELAAASLVRVALEDYAADRAAVGKTLMYEGKKVGTFTVSFPGDPP